MIDTRSALSLLHQIEQARSVDAVESRGRLVHDQNAGVDRERLGDLDDLLVGDGKIAGQRIGRDRRPEPPQEPARLLAHCPPVEEAEARGLDAEKDVLRDRAVRQQAQFLVDDADPGAARGERVRERDLPSVEPDGSAVGLIDAAEDLDERRFSRAVLAAQRMDLAASASKTDLVERPHAWKRLGDVEHLESERRFIHPSSSRAEKCPRPPPIPRRCAPAPRAALADRGASCRPS